MDLFARSWTALRTAVDELSDQDWERPSGCAGWLVRDLVCHLVISAQDVLITLVTPAETEPTVDSVTYWQIVEPPTGEDPLDALIPRLAAAYDEPRLLKFHFDDLGSAAGRAAELADPAVPVSTRDEVLTVGDYLSAYVLEWTLHHLDLIAYLPSAAEPPAETLAAARALLEKIVGGTDSGVVLRQGRAADRDRTSHSDHHGDGRAGRPRRETPGRARLNERRWWGSVAARPAPTEQNHMPNRSGRP